MTKTQSLHKFMNGFGMEAYAIGNIPDSAKLPYITYEKGFSPEGYSASVHVYLKTTSELTADSKAEEICATLRRGGLQIPCEDGQLWLTLESPEWFSVENEKDNTIKHRVINLLITDFTI